MNRSINTPAAWAPAVLASAATLGALAPTHARAQADPGTPPNVLIIISDDAGWADYGFAGSTVVPTPNLDRLAQRGVMFPHAYAGSVCAPSRAMMTTGQYGARFGYTNNILDNDGPIGGGNTQGLPNAVTTIFERMQDAGYATGVVGKWHIGKNTARGDQPGNRPQDQGVETFRGLLNGSRNYFIGNQGAGDGRLRETLSDGRGSVTADRFIEADLPQGQYVTDTLGDLSVDYIQQHANEDRPFLLYSSFTAPHTPMQATAEDLAYIDATGAGLTGQRRVQAAMQYAMDRNVGRMMDRLDDPNGDGDTSDSVRDNTLILFVNDNGGDSTDTSPNYSSNLPLRGGKGQQYEGGIRVRMVMAGAGLDASFTDDDVDTYDQPVHVIDLLPTALGAAGATGSLAGETIDGVNLLPFVNGDAAGVPHEALMLSRFSSHQSAVRVGDWKLKYNGDGPNDGVWELFNLIDHPGERNADNQYDARPDVVAELARVQTNFDVQFDKPRVDNQVGNTNQNDAFRFREGAFDAANWSDADSFVAVDASGNRTVNRRDGVAGSVFEFRAKPNASYTATNNLLRYSGQDFITSTLRFTDRDGVINSTGVATINGLPVLMANTLDGDAPRLQLHAAYAADQPAGVTFTFDLALPLHLYDDLRITGDGDMAFVLSGGLHEYRAGRSVTKTGESVLTLTAASELTGTVTVEDGELRAAHEDALGLADVAVLGGTLALAAPAGAESAVDFIADDAAVTLAGDGVLHLAFAGVESVAALSIDGQPLAPGLYAAADLPDHLTGDGALRVVPEPAVASLALASLLFARPIR